MKTMTQTDAAWTALEQLNRHFKTLTATLTDALNEGEGDPAEIRRAIASVQNRIDEVMHWV